jgi:hypothetical protein
MVVTRRPRRGAVLELDVPPLDQALDPLLLEVAGSTVCAGLEAVLAVVKSPTKDFSHRPSVRMTWAIASARAPSVPGLISRARSEPARVVFMCTSTAVIRVLGTFTPRM